MQRLRLSSFLLVASWCSEWALDSGISDQCCCVKWRLSAVDFISSRLLMLILCGSQIPKWNSWLSFCVQRCPFAQKTVRLDWNDLLRLAEKSALAGDTATPDPFHRSVCTRERCACADHLATASSRMKGLYQKGWQCERLVAGFEVGGLITLQRDWFGFSCRGCPGLRRRMEERRGRGGRRQGEVWEEQTTGHAARKGWRSFNLDLNRKLLPRVPLLLSQLWHQQVAVGPVFTSPHVLVLLRPLRAFSSSKRTSRRQQPFPQI